jgi:hypothetical protein
MDPNYRASEQQWSRVEGMGIRHRFAGSECLLELRARIEALEAAQQPDQITYEPRWHMLSEEEPQIGDHCIYKFHPSQLHPLGTYPSLLPTYGAWHDESTERIYRKGFWAPYSGLFVGDPRRISWRMAMPHEIPPAAEESSATAPPAPAGGLVDGICRDLPLSPGEVRAVVREVVAWLRSEPWLGRAAADRLEQEANR